MPKHDVHKAVSELILGRSYPSVDKALDWPARFLGPSHQRMFHSLPEAFIIGLVSSQTIQGGLAACLHVLVDSVNGYSKDLKRGGSRRSITKR